MREKEKLITDKNYNSKDALDYETARSYLITKSNKTAWLITYISLALIVMLGVALIFLMY